MTNHVVFFQIDFPRKLLCAFRGGFCEREAEEERRCSSVGSEDRVFDGRYTGTVPLSRIQSRVVPLLAFW